MKKLKTTHLILKASQEDKFPCWKIFLRESDEQVGEVTLNDYEEYGYCEIFCSINPTYQNRGYAFEAMRFVIDWLFLKNSIYYIRADSSMITSAAARKLERKLEFKSMTSTYAKTYVEIEKSKTFWIALMMTCGISLGISFGITVKTAIVGTLLGMGVGYSLDLSDRKKRKSLKSNWLKTLERQSA